MNRINLLCLFLGLGLIIVACSLWLASLSGDDWIATKAPTHPPIVDIQREGQGVRIRYYGGWTDSFIDHLSVQIDGFPEKKYMAMPGKYIYYPLVPPNATVVVKAFDKSVQSYQQIGHATV